MYQTNDYDDGITYPPACDGPFSGRYSPMKEGRGTPLRRSNTVVLGSRPTSRINLGTQVNTFVTDTHVTSISVSVVDLQFVKIPYFTFNLKTIAYQVGGEMSNFDLKTIGS